MLGIEKIAAQNGEKIAYISGTEKITYAELLKNNPLPLFAPQNGKMCRTIHESASCKAHYRFSYKGTVICEFVSDKAGFEFEYN